MPASASLLSARSLSLGTSDILGQNHILVGAFLVGCLVAAVVSPHQMQWSPVSWLWWWKISLHPAQCAWETKPTPSENSPKSIFPYWKQVLLQFTCFLPMSVSLDGPQPYLISFFESVLFLINSYTDKLRPIFFSFLTFYWFPVFGHGTNTFSIHFLKVVYIFSALRQREIIICVCVSWWTDDSQCRMFTKFSARLESRLLESSSTMSIKWFCQLILCSMNNDELPQSPNQHMY